MENEEQFGCSGSCGTCGGCGSYDEESLPIIELLDENGKEVMFEKIDVVVLDDGRSFLIASKLNFSFDEEDELVILEIKEENGEQVYDDVQDESLYKDIYSRFLKQQGIEE